MYAHPNSSGSCRNATKYLHLFAVTHWHQVRMDGHTDRQSGALGSLQEPTILEV